MCAESSCASLADPWMGPLTRRRFVVGTAGLAAAVALPRTAAAKRRRRKLNADVCVVGAGWQA